MPLNINLQQILLHMLNFVLLFAALYFLLYKPVLNFMDKRKKHYEDMAKEADETLARALEQKEEYENRLAQAQKEIDELKANARKEILEKNTVLTEEAHAQADNIIKTAKEKAALEKENIIKEAHKDMVSIVAEATKKLSEEDSDAVDFDSFLDNLEKSNQ